jgi:hypothetical protein
MTRFPPELERLLDATEAGELIITTITHDLCRH